MMNGEFNAAAQSSGGAPTAKLPVKSTSLRDNMDKELHELAVEPQKTLETDATVPIGDYTEHNLGEYDVIFIYADHNWPESFQKKLARESNGTLYSLHNIYKPDKLKKGKTYWIGQVPFISYDLASSE